MECRPEPKRRALLGVIGAILAGSEAVAQPPSLYVVVSAQSQWRSLSTKEVLALYTGRVRTLGDDAPATPLDQRRDGTARETFYRVLTGMDIARINSYWARLHFTGQVLPPEAVGDDADVVRRLLADPSAVGYLTHDPQNPNLRIALTLAAKPRN